MTTKFVYNAELSMSFCWILLKMLDIWHISMIGGGEKFVKIKSIDYLLTTIIVMIS